MEKKTNAEFIAECEDMIAYAEASPRHATNAIFKEVIERLKAATEGDQLIAAAEKKGHNLIVALVFAGREIAQCSKDQLNDLFDARVRTAEMTVASEMQKENAELKELLRYLWDKLEHPGVLADCPEKQSIEQILSTTSEGEVK